MPPVKRSKDGCPLCESPIEEYLIHFDTKIIMCENVKCSYPFNSNDATRFVVQVGDGNASIKSRKRAKPMSDRTQKSVNGKKQETTYSLTSPIEQKDKPLVLALPSKSISKGSLLAPTLPTMTSKLNHDLAAKKLPTRPQQTVMTTTSTIATTGTATVDGIKSGILSPPALLPETTCQQPPSKNNYTLADIELLLNDGDEDSGSTVVTPKEDATGMNTMVWLDDLFQDQEHHSSDHNIKCNPLQTNQDLDSFLGISLFQ
ncbi:uncharacterized protein BX664DRAFT_383521 [Halteromyces radiatus]|uniref:uncharacterized protein n=1 Tax=Halteromyces radiatus TaxID=101107 RepID=UPI002220FE62|nr:uncharacterized protein BX664DRAFT_383521 [Halteromyces radiatus]KAI8097209.1 hypothetical protein BX664DRAFT_383521 [Halteromyces radiatus]